MMNQIEKIILVVGHGSRVEKSNQSFLSFLERFKTHIPECEVRHGFLELAEPSLKEALEESASAAKEVVVVPLMLLTAGHIKHDIRGAVREAEQHFPLVSFKLAHAFGVHPKMARLYARRLQEAGERVKASIEKTAVLMIGRGSSDSDANSDFCKLVKLVEEAAPYSRCAYSFMAVATPTVEEGLLQLVREQPERIILGPYLLFPGWLTGKLERLVKRFQQTYPNIRFELGETLGEAPAICELLKQRLDEVEKHNEAASSGLRY